MRAVHENAYKPKQSNETKFVVNIRPINHSAAVKSAAKNGGAPHVNITDVGVRNAAPSHNSIVVGVNWRRIFTVSSLIVSLLLISGSLYLHLMQKSHFGRLHRDQHISTRVGGVEATTVFTPSPAPPPLIEYNF